MLKLKIYELTSRCMFYPEFQRPLLLIPLCYPIHIPNYYVSSWIYMKLKNKAILCTQIGLDSNLYLSSYSLRQCSLNSFDTSLKWFNVLRLILVPGGTDPVWAWSNTLKYFYKNGSLHGSFAALKCIQTHDFSNSPKLWLKLKIKINFQLIDWP